MEETRTQTTTKGCEELSAAESRGRIKDDLRDIITDVLSERISAAKAQRLSAAVGRQMRQLEGGLSPRGRP